MPSKSISGKTMGIKPNMGISKSKKEIEELQKLGGKMSKGLRPASIIYKTNNDLCTDEEQQAD